MKDIELSFDVNIVSFITLGPSDRFKINHATHFRESPCHVLA